MESKKNENNNELAKLCKKLTDKTTMMSIIDEMTFIGDVELDGIIAIKKL